MKWKRDLVFQLFVWKMIDKINYDLVVIDEFENKNLGVSIMNRLIKTCFTAIFL